MTLGRTTTDADIDRAIEILVDGDLDAARPAPSGQPREPVLDEGDDGHERRRRFLGRRGAARR